MWYGSFQTSRITRSERVDLRVLQSEPPAHASHRNRLKTTRFCLSYLSTATITTTAKSSAWKRGLTSPHSLRLSPRDGRQQPKQKSLRSTAHRLAIHDNSTYFLMPLWTTCPGREASTVSWALWYQSPTKKMPHRLASRPIWRKHFSQVRFFLPEDSSLCHTDKTLPGKGHKAQIYCHCPSLMSGLKHSH